jgi:predicted nucleic acid-binding protein
LKLLVDTSVWSIAMRRDHSEGHPSVDFLADALRHEGSIFTTGLILQEILQGFSGPKARKQILDRFTPLPLIVPQREDHTAAADLRNECRRRGLQIGTIDALLARLCIRYELVMLSTDRDFEYVARIAPLRLWASSPSHE